MVVHEYLKLFVFRKKMIDYRYFMDEMQDWEIGLLADSVNAAMRDEWEMTRWIVYSTIQPYLKKSMKEKPMKDIIPLPFDEEESEERSITTEQINKLKEHSKIVAQRFQKKK